MVSFAPVTRPEQCAALATLAREIWTAHFTPIIGSEQVEYMLEKFQSAQAIEAQINQQGYAYFLLLQGTEIAGYLGFQVEAEALFLSKLYLKESFRGQDIARQAIDWLVDLAQQMELPRIYLTCNKHNTHTMQVYRALGFRRTRDIKTDIGQGYVMDDYIWELPV